MLELQPELQGVWLQGPPGLDPLQAELRVERVSARQPPKTLSGSYLQCREENWFGSDGSALFLR
jgi:hypothetical protein